MEFIENEDSMDGCARLSTAKTIINNGGKLENEVTKGNRIIQ